MLIFGFKRTERELSDPQTHVLLKTSATSQKDGKSILSERKGIIISHTCKEGCDRGSPTYRTPSLTHGLGDDTLPVLRDLVEDSLSRKYPDPIWPVSNGAHIQRFLHRILNYH